MPEALGRSSLLETGQRQDEGQGESTTCGSRVSDRALNPGTVIRDLDPAGSRHPQGFYTPTQHRALLLDADKLVPPPPLTGLDYSPVFTCRIKSYRAVMPLQLLWQGCAQPLRPEEL